MEELRKFIAEWSNSEDFPFEDVVVLGREYYLSNSKTKNLIKNIKIEAQSVGTFLGMKKKFFEPSIALIELIKDITKNKVSTNSKSAWLFACGRDLFEENVSKKEGKDKKVIVLNEKGEVFGYAAKKKDGKKIIYVNRLDIGYYLRREKR